MPIEQFNYRKPANSAREGVVLVSQAWGSRVSGTDRVGSAGANIAPAGLFSTAPYIDEAGVSHASPHVSNGAVDEPKLVRDPTLCSATRADGKPCVQPKWRDGLCTRHAVLAEKAVEVTDD